MINKIFKRIHNKYSTLFKFIFFLRHLFGIFFIAVILFLSIPYFFDYKKQDIVIKKYLLESIKDVIVTDDIISVSKLLNENNIIIFANISSMRVQLFSNLELDKLNFQKFNKISNV